VIEYDDKTALIVVDVQNDFADPGGNLYVQGGEGIISFVNDEIDKAIAGGAAVFYTQDWHPASTPHFETDGGVWPVHCVMNTWGAQFHPRLTVAGEVVRKGSHGEDGYSGFTERDPISGDEKPTPLDRLIKERGAERVVILGLATDYCVKATALDAIERGYDVTLLRDGMRAVNLDPNDGAKALTEVEQAGGRLK
jgi:nicotinamidase/pyrazinamidase